MLDLFRSVAPDHVRFSTQLPAAGPFVAAGEDLVRDAIARLVANATEAVDPGTGGDVVLSVEEITRAQLMAWRTYPPAWTADHETYASLAVRDTGSGMTDDVLDRLFEPFYSTKLIGRGLGLTLVLAAARAMGGAVAVETAVGRGSTFRLLLPIAPAVAS
jgi:signal transduction histidine kinase